MNKPEQPITNEYKERNCKNTRTLKTWSAAWVISMAVATFAPRFIWEYNTLFSTIASLLSLGIGFGMLIANRNYLRGLDEMQQRIMFDAMGLSLGVGLIVGLSYDSLEDIKLITFKPEIGHLVFIMCITYLGWFINGRRKYQ